MDSEVQANTPSIQQLSQKLNAIKIHIVSNKVKLFSIVGDMNPRHCTTT
ncbi:MAG: hypothetical protein WCO06_07065 [Candidatus Roizmanbacteria bacterium]